MGQAGLFLGRFLLVGAAAVGGAWIGIAAEMEPFPFIVAGPAALALVAGAIANRTWTGLVPPALFIVLTIALAVIPPGADYTGEGVGLVWMGLGVWAIVAGALAVAGVGARRVAERGGEDASAPAVSARASRPRTTPRGSR